MAKSDYKKVAPNKLIDTAQGAVFETYQNFQEDPYRSASSSQKDCVQGDTTFSIQRGLPQDATERLLVMMKNPEKMGDELRDQMFPYIENFLREKELAGISGKYQEVLKQLSTHDTFIEHLEKNPPAFESHFFHPELNSNYRLNTQTITTTSENNKTVQVPGPTSSNMGSPHMTSHKKSNYQGIAASTFVNNVVRTGLLPEDAIKRAQTLLQPMIQALVNREIDRNGDNPDWNNVKFVEHRYLGGIANDAESIGEAVISEAIERAKQNVIRDTLEQHPIYTKIKLDNVMFHNTCLTSGKDLLGTTTQRKFGLNPYNHLNNLEIPNAVRNMRVSTDATRGESIQSRKEYLISDPQFKEQCKNLNNGKEYDIENLAQLRAEDDILLKDTALKALKSEYGMNTFSLNGLKKFKGDCSYKSSIAAYTNIALQADGFHVDAGCKSSIDRAGGEFTTRTAYTAFIRKYKEFPTSSMDEDKKNDLATMYLNAYHDITAEIGKENRGAPCTKTFERFCPPEVKDAFKARTEEAIGFMQQSAQDNLAQSTSGKGAVALVAEKSKADAEKSKADNENPLTFAKLRTELSTYCSDNELNDALTDPSKLKTHKEEKIRNAYNQLSDNPQNTFILQVAAQDAMLSNYVFRDKLTHEGVTHTVSPDKYFGKIDKQAASAYDNIHEKIMNHGATRAFTALNAIKALLSVVPYDLANRAASAVISLITVIFIAPLTFLSTSKKTEHANAQYPLHTEIPGKIETSELSSVSTKIPTDPVKSASNRVVEFKDRLNDTEVKVKDRARAIEMQSKNRLPNKNTTFQKPGTRH